jgi:hypothetical protein
MPAVYIVLISDFPIISGNTLFFVYRTGKLNWFLGQNLFIIMSISVYIFLILIAGMLFSGGGFFGTHWSDTVTKYNARFPDEANSFTSELIRTNLYNQIPIVTATIYTIILLMMYLLLLALVLSIFKMLHLKMAGVFSSYTVVALGVATTSLMIPSMWFFPMANTICWLHYKKSYANQ